jgi:tetratricopeptide (TPR) repeat protein
MQLATLTNALVFTALTVTLCVNPGLSQEIPINDYNPAIKFNPNLAQAYGNRAYIYYQLGDKQKAREDLQQAAQLFMAQGNTALYEKAMALLKGL